MFNDIYKNRKVLVTGHTGFKGSWLCAWLLTLGARVAGFSVDFLKEPSHFMELDLSQHIKHYQGDIRNLQQFKSVMLEFQPEIVFHLAAQSLVRFSYQKPIDTFTTNALGTLNVLEATREIDSVRAVVIITSDKAYRNFEWEWGYRESDILGGEDPYSASKACAEMIFYSYVRSYFSEPDSVRIATARAGNVIGGGDWAEDRIIPDCIRAWSNNKELILRQPNATRPWQHVLEPLSGYLWLASCLYNENQKINGQSYNFGPNNLTNYSVETLIRSMHEYWPNAKWKIAADAKNNYHEYALLKLCCDKALTDLRWHAVLDFKETVQFTSEWFHQYYQSNLINVFQLTTDQIQKYSDLAKERGLEWRLRTNQKIVSMA